MIKVIVELHPFGDKNTKQVLRNVYIANMGRIGFDVCQYDVWVDKDPRTVPRPKANVRVEHKVSYGALNLVRTAFTALGKEELLEEETTSG